jgi:hypothetical protein
VKSDFLFHAKMILHSIQIINYQFDVDEIILNIHGYKIKSLSQKQAFYFI